MEEAFPGSAYSTGVENVRCQIGPVVDTGENHVHALFFA